MENLIDFDTSPRTGNKLTHSVEPIIPNKIISFDKEKISEDNVLSCESMNLLNRSLDTNGKPDYVEFKKPYSFIEDDFMGGNLDFTSSELKTKEEEGLKNIATSFCLNNINKLNAKEKTDKDEVEENAILIEFEDKPAKEKSLHTGKCENNTIKNEIKGEDNILIELEDKSESEFEKDNSPNEKFEYTSSKSTPDSQNSSMKSTPNSDKISKQNKVDHKNRLLKLSLSNALVQSPLGRKCSIEDGTSPENSIFKEAAKLAKQLSQMNLTISPKSSSDDSYEDLTKITPHWIDSESDLSKELELMKIPILDKLDDEINKNIDFPIDKKIRNDFNNILDKHKWNMKKEEEKKINASSLNENNDIGTQVEESSNFDNLISSLKNTIEKSNTDSTKKVEAERLLENLSNLLKDDTSQQINENGNYNLQKIKDVDESNTYVMTPPQPIIRQGTFDIDLKVNNESDEINNDSNGKSIEEVTEEEEVQAALQPQVSDLLEKINKAFGGTQNVNILQTTVANNNCTGNNPTYIVLVETPSKNNIKQNPENHDKSPENEFRRRCSSLTLPKDIKFKNKIDNEGTKNFADSSKHENEFKTPKRSNILSRRNSISSSTSRPSPGTRNSMYMHNNSFQKTSNLPNKPSVIMNDQNRKTVSNLDNNIHQSKSTINLKPENNSTRIRLKSRENVGTKGPLKATLPIPAIQLIPGTPKRTEINKRESLNDSHSSILNNGSVFGKNLPPSSCSTPMVRSPKTPATSSSKINPAQRLSTTPNQTKKSNSLDVSFSSLPKRRKSLSVSSSKVTNESNSLTNTRRDTPKVDKAKLTGNRKSVLVKQNKENQTPRK